MSQAMDDVADSSSRTVTLETGSSEPTDRTTSITADNVVGYEDQIEVEPLDQNVNEDECKVTRGGELIPRSPIRKPFRLSLAVFSGIMMVCGFAMATLGAMIAGRISKYTNRHCPALWWIGLPPTILSVIGFYTVTNKSRRYLFFWGMLTALNLVTQTSLMGLKGNFFTGLYDVWPLITTHNGHPLCKVMVGRCYCQDYFHGIYSQVRMPHTQYIPEDILWKETGFLHCEDVRFVSELYFSTMAFFGVFALVSLLGSAVAYAGSACSMEDETAFEPLQDIGGSHRGIDTPSDNIYKGDSRYCQMKDLSPTKTQNQEVPARGSTSATVKSHTYVDPETGLHFSKWS
ncbi:hypothetical protein NP493_74g01013 [Ridgeia piscesae]|uniref:Uncharacterized protein n=1 Tax=Ridgeia piscesae TaxID=27915 RepID=A0AAD9P9R8_RIDPI|nr:hypothetical protein NP493_74g01013 [Ridgeia piscesae]